MGVEVLSTEGAKMSILIFWCFDSRSYKNSDTEYDEEVEDANEETDEEDLFKLLFLFRVFCQSDGISKSSKESIFLLFFLKIFVKLTLGIFTASLVWLTQKENSVNCILP